MDVAVDKIGRVLRIEKTSIHDGEGLRTVVFLKGCPLRCKWCSTPESQKMEKELDYGMDMTVGEIVHEVCKDEVFFFHSGGGVTISGGEALMQPEFVQEILKGCCQQGVQTAIETSLFASYSNIQMLLPYLGAMYIDFKVFDEERHRFYTGVSNEKIKENLVRVNEEFRGEIHLRIPVIPTVNLFAENMEKTGQFVKDLKRVKDIELLPYHRLGLHTYEKMGRVYELKGIQTPPMEEMKEMAKILHMASGKPIKIKGAPVEG